MWCLQVCVSGMSVRHERTALTVKPCVRTPLSDRCLDNLAAVVQTPLRLIGLHPAPHPLNSKHLLKACTDVQADGAPRLYTCCLRSFFFFFFFFFAPLPTACYLGPPARGWGGARTCTHQYRRQQDQQFPGSGLVTWVGIPISKPATPQRRSRAACSPARMRPTCAQLRTSTFETTAALSPEMHCTWRLLDLSLVPDTLSLTCPELLTVSVLQKRGRYPGFSALVSLMTPLPCHYRYPLLTPRAGVTPIRAGRSKCNHDCYIYSIVADEAAPRYT